MTEGTVTYLTTRQACERLGISQPTLSRWVASGKAVAAVRGTGSTGAMFFSPTEIERLESER